MALDGITVSAVVKELSGLLTGARISKIAQPENDELMLTLKGTRGGQTRLLLSASASLPLIYITETNKPGPLTAPNFCMLLRTHVGKREDPADLAARAWSGLSTLRSSTMTIWEICGART